jgi:diadenosine tetraphosphate (Ap4A) HIT family hydrolase
MAAAIDRALTELYGSRRTMIASLGWNVDDHVHVHCVPTFHPTVTRGFENFGGAYEPPPHEVSRVVAEVRGYLASHAPPCG